MYSTSSASMTHKALHTPLLGVEHVLVDEESYSQQNESPTKRTTETVDDDDDEHISVGTSWGPSWIMSILFPLLIFIQFWMALEVEDDDDDDDERSTAGATILLSWPNVSMTIGIFAVSNILYQRACQDSKIKSLIILLLPEVITVLVLGFVMFETVTRAFLALNVGILLLSSLVLVETAHSLFYSSNHESQNDEDDEENKQFDILVV
jgi:hypothetical protein